MIEDCKLIVTDVEVLRLHYAETLRHWEQRFQANRAKIRELYKPDWKLWFPEESKAKNGSPDDPRMIMKIVKEEPIPIASR